MPAGPVGAAGTGGKGGGGVGGGGVGGGGVGGGGGSGDTNMLVHVPSLPPAPPGVGTHRQHVEYHGYCPFRPWQYNRENMPLVYTAPAQPVGKFAPLTDSNAS